MWRIARRVRPVSSTVIISAVSGYFKLWGRKKSNAECNLCSLSVSRGGSNVGAWLNTCRNIMKRHAGKCIINMLNVKEKEKVPCPIGTSIFLILVFHSMTFPVTFVTNCGIHSFWAWFAHHKSFTWWCNHRPSGSKKTSFQAWDLELLSLSQCCRREKIKLELKMNFKVGH